MVVYFPPFATTMARLCSPGEIRQRRLQNAATLPKLRCGDSLLPYQPVLRGESVDLTASKKSPE